MAKRITKVEREQAEADQFRAEASSLFYLRHNDWRDWELDWLEAMAKRSSSYRFSEKERAKLGQLRRFSKSLPGYGAYTVPEVIQMGYSFRHDVAEEDQEFLEKIHAWGATELKIRQVRRLVQLCRMFEKLDADLDAAA